MHYATAKLFADENDYSVMTREAKKYFANILMHLSNQVRSAMKALEELDLDVKILAPDHGPLFRTPESIAFILDLYKQMASGARGGKAVVFYASMWGSTEKIAVALADGIRSAGAEAKVSAIGVSDRSDIMTDVLDAGLVCVGSPTMNNQMYPSVADVLFSSADTDAQSTISAESYVRTARTENPLRALSSCCARYGTE